MGIEWNVAWLVELFLEILYERGYRPVAQQDHHAPAEPGSGELRAYDALGRSSDVDQSVNRFGAAGIATALIHKRRVRRFEFLQRSIVGVTDESVSSACGVESDAPVAIVAPAHELSDHGQVLASKSRGKSLAT